MHLKHPTNLITENPQSSRLAAIVPQLLTIIKLLNIFGSSTTFF
jgi:hypothetical protein